MTNKIRLRQINCFLEIARCGSLGAAANHLQISQPAASKTLRELEEILGKPLFDRTGRRLVLNSAGRIFQQYAGAALIDLQRAQDRVKGEPTERFRIAIGVLPSVAANLVPRAALQFQKHHPNCTLRIASGPNWQLLNQLRDGSLDMVIGRMPNPDNMEGLSFQHLSTEEVVAVVGVNHPLVSERFSANLLSNFPLILPPKGALIYPVVSSYLLMNNLQNVQPVFESVSSAFGRKIVMLSDAIWFISKSVVEDEISAGQLTALRLASPMMAGAIGICLREGALLSDDIKGLISTISQHQSPLKVNN